MTRSEFFRALPALAAAPLVLALPSPNRPRVGHIKAGDAGALYVDKVLLDGREVSHVFELDDVEGWLRRYVPDEPGEYTWGPRVERLKGEVEVVWL